VIPRGIAALSGYCRQPSGTIRHFASATNAIAVLVHC
jgi:hypothetical protein